MFQIDKVFTLTFRKVANKNATKVVGSKSATQHRMCMIGLLSVISVHDSLDRTVICALK